MKKQLTTYQRSAQAGRSRALFLLSIKSRTTDAQLASLLTYNAIRLGLIAPRKPVPGRNVATWKADREGEKVQAWVGISAVDLLCKHFSWEPESDQEWAAWSSSQMRLYPLTNNAKAFTKTHFPQFSAQAASLWMQKAIDEAKPYQPDNYRHFTNAADSTCDRALAVVRDIGRAVTEQALVVQASLSESECVEVRECPALYCYRRDVYGEVLVLEDDTPLSTVFYEEKQKEKKID